MFNYNADMKNQEVAWSCELFSLFVRNAKKVYLTVFNHDLSCHCGTVETYWMITVAGILIQ